MIFTLICIGGSIICETREGCIHVRFRDRVNEHIYVITCKFTWMHNLVLLHLSANSRIF